MLEFHYKFVQNCNKKLLAAAATDVMWYPTARLNKH